MPLAIRVADLSVVKFKKLLPPDLSAVKLHIDVSEITYEYHLHIVADIFGLSRLQHVSRNKGTL